MAQFYYTAGKIAAITPSDTEDLPDGRCYALLSDIDGLVNVIDSAGNTISNLPMQAGYNPISVSRIKTGGDVASMNLFALYEYKH